MNEQDLRALIRDVVARHVGPNAAPAAPGPASASEPAWAPHSSHGLYLTLVNVGEACLIEPSVPCNHCGYCKSHGH